MSHRTLVTGATGFIGAALFSKLQNEGVEVHGTSRRMHGASSSIHCCDLTDATAVSRLMEQVRPTTLFHLASHVTGARGVEAVLDTFNGTLRTTVNLLVAASLVGVESVIVAGSLEEYPSNEAARYPYAAAKRASQEYARYFAAAHGLAVVTARLGMVYGPGEPNEHRLVPYVISSQLRGEAPAIVNGERRVDWIYIDDVVAGMLALAARAKAHAGQAFDIGTGQAPTTSDVVAHLTRFTGGPEATFGSAPPRANDRDLVADVERTELATSWRPRIPLERGLKETVDWYRRR